MANESDAGDKGVIKKGLGGVESGANSLGPLVNWAEELGLSPLLNAKM